MMMSINISYGLYMMYLESYENLETGINNSDPQLIERVFSIHRDFDENEIHVRVNIDDREFHRYKLINKKISIMVWGRYYYMMYNGKRYIHKQVPLTLD